PLAMTPLYVLFRFVPKPLMAPIVSVLPFRFVVPVPFRAPIGWLAPTLNVGPADWLTMTPGIAFAAFEFRVPGVRLICAPTDTDDAGAVSGRAAVPALVKVRTAPPSLSGQTVTVPVAVPLLATLSVPVPRTFNGPKLSV